jgi:hypothetical protein
VRAASRQDSSQHERLGRLKIALCLAFATALLLSPKLWISTRTYPLAPVVGGIGAIPYPLDYAIFFALFALVVTAAIVSRPRPYLIGALAITVGLAIQDQSRWQPWLYQYLALLAALAAYSWQPGDPGGSRRALDISRAVMIGLYFWSGVQKINATFLRTGLGAVVDAGAVPDPIWALLVQLGFIVPSAEIAIALGLLTRRFRDAAAVTAVLVHAFVLIAIGPLGQSWNVIVWPWNVAMAAFSVILFYGDETSGPRDILALARPRATLHALVVVLFCLAPALSFAGLWDSYLSAALYSRNVRQAGIKVSEAVVERLPAAVAQHVDEQHLFVADGLVVRGNERAGLSGAARVQGGRTRDLRVRARAGRRIPRARFEAGDPHGNTRDLVVPLRRPQMKPTRASRG